MSAYVTGVGALASVGDDAVALFDALCAGRSGLADLRGFDRSRYRARRAYEIDDRPGVGVDEPGRATRWLGDAIAAALDDAGLDGDIGDVPVIVGTGLREQRSLELWWQGGAPPAAAVLGDLHFGPALRERFGATSSYTFAGACSASLYALGLAADLLAAGAADHVVVAGVDTLTESMFGLLDRVHPEPPDAVRPFDKARKGVLMGDGAAAVVLSREPGVRPRARLRGVGLSCDAYHVTAPDPAGIATAIRDAHTRAGVVPADVDLVMLHGTGTLLNDEAEASAVAEVFGDATPLVTAIKSMTGHTSGGSGLIGLVMGIAAMASGTVPPTVGLDDPVEEAAGLRFVRGVPVTAPVARVQVNAFGFGGVNAVAVVEEVA